MTDRLRNTGLEVDSNLEFCPLRMKVATFLYLEVTSMKD